MYKEICVHKIQDKKDNSFPKMVWSNCSCGYKLFEETFSPFYDTCTKSPCP